MRKGHILINWSYALRIPDERSEVRSALTVCCEWCRKIVAFVLIEYYYYYFWKKKKIARGGFKIDSKYTFFSFHFLFCWICMGGKWFILLMNLTNLNAPRLIAFWWVFFFFFRQPPSPLLFPHCWIVKRVEIACVPEISKRWQRFAAGHFRAFVREKKNRRRGK